MKSTVGRAAGARAVATLLVAAVLAFGASAAASMALAVSLEQLVARADHIVLARAVAKQSLFDAHGRIVTDVELVVERSEKGPSRPGDSLVVRSLGGVVDGIATRVIGAPTFEVGQRQLLFAIDDPEGRGVVHTLELSQGLMRVFERDGAPWVHGGGEGLALRKRREDGTLAATGAGADRPLDELLARVRELLEASK